MSKVRGISDKCGEMTLADLQDGRIESAFKEGGKVII